MRPLILFVIAGVTAIFIASPASAAIKPAVTIGLSATTVPDGSSVTVNGRVSHLRSGTKVQLQKNTGAGWRTASHPVVRHGRYTATYTPLLGSNEVRIRVPKTRSTRKAYSHTRTIQGTLRTTPVGPRSIDPLFATGRLSTGVARRVRLQAKSGDGWNTVDEVSTTDSGRFSVVAELRQSTTIRVYAPPVTIRRTKYAGLTSPTSAVAVTAVPLPNTDQPTISGDPRVGATLTAFAGAWDPDVSFGYSWLRVQSDGTTAEIPGANASTYQVGPGDEGDHLMVRLVGSKVGFLPATTESTTTTVVLPGALASAPVPTIDGAVTAARVVTAVPGTWDEGTTLTYAWQLDGVDVPRAAASSLLLSRSDIGSELTVTVTGTKTGYDPETRTSAATIVGVGPMALTPQPSFDGDAVVGHTLTVVPGTWDDGAELTYAWLRDGQPIDGATDKTYDLDEADAGTRLAVRVTGVKDGFADAAMTSASAVVTGGTLATTPAPTISGTPELGATLTAAAGDWDPGTSLSYQWQRDGVDIPGATGESLAVEDTDVGFPITVTVTGSKLGFDTVSQTSRPTDPVLPGTLQAAQPRVLGAVAVGEVLSVDTGAWSPAPVGFAYQWVRNGKDIPGATDSSYVVPSGVVNSRLAVRVTGSKLGFTSEVRTSEETGPISAGTVPTSFGCGATVLKPDGTAWRCTFDDEFSGTRLDTRKWGAEQTAAFGVHSGDECLVDSPDNIAVHDGLLHLTVRKEAAEFTCSSPRGSYRTQYTSGGVSTYGKFAQTYGRFEFRAKFPAPMTPGLQSSLWLYPSHPVGPWPSSGEIDVAEVYSVYPDRAFPFAHYNTASDVPVTGTSGVTNWHCTVGDLSEFHTYVAEWTATGLRISYDGTLCLDHVWDPAAPVEAPAPFNRPFTMIMTQVLGGKTNDFAPETTPLPAATEVDWVRAWS